MKPRLRTIPSSLGLLLLAILLLGPALPACSKDPPGVTLELKQASGPRNLGRAEIAALPAQQIESSGKDYKGVRLRDLLGSIPNHATIRARASDGYTQTINAETAARDDAIIAYEKDGDPLTAPEGPIRIVIPGSPGLSVRGLISLEIVP